MVEGGRGSANERVARGYDAAARARVRAKRAPWARPEHACYMLDRMLRWPRGLG